MWLNIHSDVLDDAVEAMAKALKIEHFGIKHERVNSQITVVYADRGDPYRLTVCAIVEKSDVKFIEFDSWKQLVDFLYTS